MDQTSASSSQGHRQPIPFPSLTVIQIQECSNLKCLFPISITRSLSRLCNMSIHGASKFERVFGYQGEVDFEDDQKGIALPYLQGLPLDELPSLKSFAPIGYHFRLPCLDYFILRGCPKLSTSFNIDSKRVVHAITEVFKPKPGYVCHGMSSAKQA
ncbi:hypothetical protein POUND7_006792 [Theobroma cacao]